MLYIVKKSYRVNGFEVSVNEDGYQRFDPYILEGYIPPVEMRDMLGSLIEASLEVEGRELSESFDG